MLNMIDIAVEQYESEMLGEEQYISIDDKIDSIIEDIKQVIPSHMQKRFNELIDLLDEQSVHGMKHLYSKGLKDGLKIKAS